MKKTALDRLDGARDHLQEFVYDIYISVFEYSRTIPEEWIKAIRHLAADIEKFKKDVKRNH